MSNFQLFDNKFNQVNIFIDNFEQISDYFLDFRNFVIEKDNVFVNSSIVNVKNAIFFSLVDSFVNNSSFKCD